MKNYLKYLFEVIAIALGITLSFMVEEWREDQQKLEKLDIILNEIKNGLESDIEDLEINLRIQENIDSCQQAILEWLGSDKKYDEAIGKMISNASFGSTFKSREAPYETFKLLIADIPTDEELKNSIAKTYDMDFEYYKYDSDKYIDLVTNMWNSINIKYFRGTDYPGTMKPIDENLLKSSNDFRYTIYTMKNFNKFLIADLKIAIKSARDTHELVSSKIASK